MLNTHAFGTAKCRRTSSHCASSSVSSRVSRVCSTAQGSSSTAVASARGKASKVPLVVYFKEDKKTVEALPGEFIAEVGAKGCMHAWGASTWLLHAAVACLACTMYCTLVHCFPLAASLQLHTEAMFLLVLPMLRAHHGTSLLAAAACPCPL